jgi:hypothetical protein
VLPNIFILYAYNLRANLRTPLRRPRSGWEDNSKVGLRESGWEVVNWIRLPQNTAHWWALENTAIHLRVAYTAGSFMTSQTIIAFSKRTLFHEVGYLVG